MKPIFEEFYFPQCGQIRYVYVDGVCSSCSSENQLERIIERKNTILTL